QPRPALALGGQCPATTDLPTKNSIQSLSPSPPPLSFYATAIAPSLCAPSDTVSLSLCIGQLALGNRSFSLPSLSFSLPSKLFNLPQTTCACLHLTTYYEGANSQH